MPRSITKFGQIIKSTSSVPGVDVVTVRRNRHWSIWHSHDGTTSTVASISEYYGKSLHARTLGYLPTVGQDLFILGHHFVVEAVHCVAGASVYISVQSCTSGSLYDLSVERYVGGLLPVFLTGQTREHA
jgi:hypothetical protein